MTHSLPISHRTARRYLLGKQGLFPGRRFFGKAGLASAFREIETVQIDPISFVARSHDLSLFARVEGYSPTHLDELMHTDRSLFDYGTILMIYPREDLPAMSAIMAKRREAVARSERVAPELREFVRQEIEARGALSSRDFKERERIRGGFNTVKDTSVALYHLWLGGEVMSHSRERNERKHDLFHRVTGLAFEDTVVPIEEAETHFFRKSLRELGLMTPAEWARNVSVMIARRPSVIETRAVFKDFVECGVVVPVRVGELATVHFVLTEDLPLLETLERDEIPGEWASAHQTEREVTFFAPLDSVVWDRERTRSLFGFDYVWEVYKPAAARKWGYYTLPVLYGDTLAGRVALRFDRKTSMLIVEGAWTEPGFHENTAYRHALNAGLERLRKFLGAEQFASEMLLPSSGTQV